MEPYTYSNHNDGMSLDDALNIIGAGYRQTHQQGIEAIMSILTDEQREVAIAEFYELLATKFERDIFNEALDRAG